MKNKMAKKIIFDSVRDRALDHSLENIVLFGERNFIEDENGVYDLVFYSKEIVPYSYEKPTSLVIPVIKEFDDSLAIEKLLNINQEYPNFEDFAVSGEFLDFYRVHDLKQGKGVEHLGKYFHVDEDSLVEKSTDPTFENRLEHIKRKIENNYL